MAKRVLEGDPAQSQEPGEGTGRTAFLAWAAEPQVARKGISPGPEPREGISPRTPTRPGLPNTGAAGWPGRPLPRFPCPDLPGHEGGSPAETAVSSGLINVQEARRHLAWGNQVPRED